MKETIMDHEAVVHLWQRLAILEEQNKYLKRFNDDLGKCLNEYQAHLRIDYNKILELVEKFIEGNFVPRKDWTQEQESQFGTMFDDYPPLTEMT